jgi:hypothetical protein
MRLDDITVGTVAIGDLRVRRLGDGAMRFSGARNAAGARDRAEAVKINWPSPGRCARSCPCRTPTTAEPGPRRACWQHARKQEWHFFPGSRSSSKEPPLPSRPKRSPMNRGITSQRVALAAEGLPLSGLLVAQGDLVGLGDVVCLDCPQSFPKALASLPQQLEGVAGRAFRSRASRSSSVFLDEVSLECGRDFVGRLQRVVDGPVPCSVVNHAASIAHRLTLGAHATCTCGSPAETG